MKTLTDFDPATRDDVMRYLARGIVEDNLPGPVQIHTRNTSVTYAGVAVDNTTDLFTWVNWLGAGATRSYTYDLGEGRMYYRTWSEVAWNGWTIRVSLTRTVVV